MAKRQSLSKKTRFEVFKRDGFMCCYCGSHPPEAILEVDHIRAVANGGTNDIDNLVTSCFACNRGKSDVPLEVAPQSIADKAAVLAEKEAQLDGYQEIQRARKDRIESECWEVANVFLDHFSGKDGSIHKSDFQSIKTFVSRLGVVEVVDSAEIAIAKKPYAYASCFKYFCGVCWSKIKEGQQ